MRDVSKMALALTAAVGISSAANAQALADAPRDPVRVAIVDIQPDRLDCKADGVKLINVTPPLPQGMREADGKAGRTSHGVIALTAFVEQVRKIDDKVPIEVYTINPFIKDGPRGQMMFSKRMLKQGLDSLEGKNVRMAVTTFSVSDATEGQKIADMFKAKGMTLFAATPNEEKDPGIYPAASQGVIAIAQDGGGRSIAKDKRYQEFTKFVFPGKYIGLSGETTGSSFATPRAAAYASYMDWKQPGIPTSDIMGAFDRSGWEVSGMPKGIKFSGGEALTKAVRQMPRMAPRQVAEVSQAVEAKAVATTPRPMAMLASSGMSR